jgi:syntaxin 16
LLGAGAGDGDAVIEMDLLPPRWLDIQDDITSRLTDVSATMKKLDQLHAKHILPGFDDESVKAREEREIEDLTLEVTRGFASCQSAIKRIDKLVQEQAKTQEHRGGLTKEDETMARNLKISLASRVSEVSTTFRKKQTAYLKKLRSLGGRPCDARLGA